MTKNDYQRMGRASGIARLAPAVRRIKAECVRLHVGMNYGVTAISYRTGRNKGLVRKWLVAAGVYKTGCRPIGIPKADGYRRKNRKTKITIK
jgi:hypothetical protein